MDPNLVFFGIIGLIFGLILLVIPLILPTLAIINSMSLKQYYDDNKDKVEKYKWDFAQCSFVCTIMAIVSFFLAIMFFFKFPGVAFLFSFLGTISYLIAICSSIGVSIILIEIFKSENNDIGRKNVILSSIYLGLVFFPVIIKLFSSILKNNINNNNNIDNIDLYAIINELKLGQERSRC